MPADSSGPIKALKRLLGAWRQRRAARRRAHVREFMHMSDRMLADIGVRRADVHAAMSGLVPARHIARTTGGSSWTAQVHRLRPRCHQPPGGLAGTDLGAAA
ncbi:MAG TPA: DUF1127 domain-containing protein [Steroidobacteraceae bacterium]|nr:DUF1127 domain-containing protein [Steroidobacteraceae bacterium]